MMKYCSIWCLLLFITATGQSQHKKRDTPFAANVTRILFLGNSITYQGDYITDIEAYLVTRFPKRHFEYINVGLPSETVSGLSEEGHAGGAFPRPDLHERLARVLALTKPDLVFANYGMNDGIYLPLNTERFEKFKVGIRWMHNEVVKSGAKIIHLTPPIYNEKIGGAKGYNGVLDAYSNWLLSLKDSLHWNVIDIHFPMAAYQQERQVSDPDFSLAKDGVHPGDLGHWIMARQVLMYLDNNTTLATAQDISILLAMNAHGQEIFQLVKERQLFMKDAWLSAAKHTRPGMNTGLPLDTAKLKAATIESRIRELLK